MTTPYKKTIEQAFDAGAETYDSIATIQKKAGEKLLSFAPQENIKNILEVGCGSGALTKLLKEKFPKASITAIDLSQNMIDTCRQNIQGVEFKKADGESFETDQTFDLIISNMTVQWFEEPLYALDRWIGLLSSHGQILYSVPGPHHFQEWAKHCRRQKLPSGLHPCPLYPGLVAEKYFLQNYESGFDFLRTLKQSGAHRPHKNYEPLTAAQIRRLCQSFSGALRWHILFGQLKKPTSSR